ncbi:iron-sulfur cluster assembly accessory protein [Gottfriedia acidiceleris]|uniref:HesB/IscA family protein n=1 Tax=Bacillaceae TaxID=186817 RepID=UPI000BECA54E|nr:iron-sulfur cluster assembly accessory protein [Bacillus sp. AFS096315]PEC49587.1 iron-sulfur cluster assembly accessory protein [Bacillus sp. AFS096315]
MITVTEQAGLKIKEMIENEEDQNTFVRLGVKGGGCSGLSYGLGFDPQKNDDDTELEYHGIKFLIDYESAPILKGVVIDFKESLLGGGFTIENPNAIASCGCGSSFRTATNAGTPEEC